MNISIASNWLKSLYWLFALSISTLSAQPVYEINWNNNNDPGLGGGGGLTLTQTVDSACSHLSLSVTDTATAPLGAFSPLALNPTINGAELVDLSGNMTFYIRARSREQVTLGMLLRAGDGSSAFRTDLLEVNIPGDTTSWTEHAFTFDTTHIGGFDSTDLRDVWFYLDRGTENFAGDDFVFDFFSIGGIPDSASWSTCPVSIPPIPADTTFYPFHWADTSTPVLSGSGGATLTQNIDTTCSFLALSVTDTANAPLGAFSPLVLNPVFISGNDIIDLSGNMSFNIRARSREQVLLGMLLRAGDGSAALRTDVLEVSIPGDTTSWTEHTFIFDSNTIAGFDSTDLRDVWFYLDRGTENFAGNEFILDYFTIGDIPSDTTWSACPLDTAAEVSEPFVVHWTDETDPAFSGSGGNLLTQTPDTACSMLTVSVTDPTTNPLGTFSPLVVNPQNPDGSELKSLSGLMTFYVRVRSEAEVTLGLVLRSGDGSSLFRTDRIDQIIPASTTNWTELTYTFDANTLGGFDSTDLRDMWFYLDPGTPNFAGEEVVFDYVAVGEKPESLTHSTCIDAPPFVFPWVVHWANPTDPIPNGAGAEALVIETDTICSQLQITIPDPIDTPYPAFSALALIPRDEFGNDIRDISNQLRVSIRARSLQAVDLSILMRSGNGSITERTNLITQTVPAGLGEWTNLSFNFTGSNQAGLDPTDLRDIFLFLDRESPNFPGNEIYMDYVTVGIAPSPAQNSTCVTVPIDDFPSFINRIGPNPLPGGQNLEVSLKTSAGASITLKLLSLTGQVLQKTTLATSSPQTYLNWELPHMPQGLYLLMISSGPQSQLYKLEIRS